MRRYFFNMFLTSDQCRQYYSGDIRYVIVTDDNGERIQLQFRHLLPYISINGIRGRFRLTLSEQFAFVALEKIN